MSDKSALITPPAFNTTYSGAPAKEPPALIDNAPPRGEVSAEELVRFSSAEARTLLSREECFKLNTLPLAIINTVAGKELTTAAAAGSELEAIKALRFKTEMGIRPILFDSRTIQDAIFKAYSGDDAALLNAARALEKSAPPKTKAAPNHFREAASDTAAFLSALMEYAAARGASDLHFIPSAEGSGISLRIHGIIRRRNERTFSKKQHEEIVSRIKILARLNIAEKRAPQDGSFEIEISQNEKRAVRVGIMPTIHGERASLRFHGGGDLRELSELGLGHSLEERLLKSLQMRSGLIIFSGSTGSGKTTSLYACLAELHRLGRSIITIEDPVEQILPWASQTSLDKKAGIDYPNALSAALRHDPDAILLGEIRDGTSAEIAVQAALTGHMVLTTLHARGLEEIPLRLKGLGINPLDLKGSLSLAVFQRLLPRLCPKCKVFDLASSKDMGLEVFKAVGCASCEHTGFSGRILVAGADLPWGGKRSSKDGDSVSLNLSLRTALLSGSISFTEYLSAGGSQP